MPNRRETRSAFSWIFRNEALHGVVENVGASVASLLLIAVLYLTLLHPEAVADPGAAAEG